MALEVLPGLGARTLRPRVNPQVNAAAHVQSPEEYFVLSRVDGSTSYDELLQISALGAEATLTLLRRFKDAGLIFHPGETPAPAPTTPAPRATPVPRATPRTPVPARAATTPRPGPGTSLLERLDDGADVELAPLGEAPGLPELTRARIVRLHRRLKTLSPRQLLGVTDDAPAAAIKRAYFEASKELHPDRFFGRDIGAYRPLLSEIFAKLSSAFETLQTEARKK